VKLNAKNISIFIAGFIWLLVALRIGSRGISWLMPYFENPSWKLIFLLVSILIGFAKGTTVLRKAAERNLSNLGDIRETPMNYLFGWLKIYGTKGTIMISLMIAIGIGLRFWRANGGDPYNIFGFIYLGIALGLLIGSSYYFKSLFKNS
jgi:hypothetical protein